MEAEFTHLQFPVFDGEGVGVRHLGNGRVEGRIEDRDVRYAGESIER